MSWLEKLEPHRIGLPKKYTSWRPYQAEAVYKTLEDEHRFTPINAPTGLGKSMVGLGVALVEKVRAVYLTATKALQDQIMREDCGIKLIKGRNNYRCVGTQGIYSCEEYSRDCRAKICPIHGPKNPECTVATCDAWAGECPYKQAYQEAILGDLVVTNYSYWVQVNRFAAGLGAVGMLICDEAHSLPEELCGLMSTTITPEDLMVLDSTQPEYDNITHAWKEWGDAVVTRALAEDWMGKALHRAQISEHGSRDYVRARNRLEMVLRKVQVVRGIEGHWIVEPVRDGWQFDPVWPFQHTERWLWCGVPKVVLMSATLTPKTMGLLGIAKDKYRFQSYPYVFPRRNAPVYQIDSAHVSYNMKPANKTRWLGMIAQALKRRTDRKGIVHTVSYDRRNEILNYLSERHPDLVKFCMTHEPRETAEVIRQFKASKEPRWLLSPSITTGHDFPDEQCEFVIWTKLPFPSSQSQVMKARQKEDKQYAGYLMIQELIQGAGRGMRSGSDYCETLIMDNNWRWVSRRFAHMIPDWFTVQYRDTIPPPPPRLALIREMEEGETDNAVPENEPSTAKERFMASLKAQPVDELEDDVPF
jgi:Rad3-related DNA helicase